MATLGQTKRLPFCGCAPNRILLAIRAERFILELWIANLGDVDRRVEDGGRLRYGWRSEGPSGR